MMWSEFRKSFSFWLKEYPRISRNPRVLMYLVYFWQERLTSLGHCLSIFLLFALFFVWVPGAFAVKAFLLFCCALLIIALFTLLPPKHIEISRVKVPKVCEGEKAEIFATVFSKKETRAVKLGAFRMHPALKYIFREEYASLKPEESKTLSLKILAARRGAFKIPVIALVVPDTLGIATILKKAAGDFELLVFPRTIRVLKFSFLEFGKSGRAFAPYMQKDFRRGLDFIGVREYREGDSLRDLHHRSFARYGKPFTKEFAAERGEGLILLLDVSCEKLIDRARVENAVRLTAGVAAWLLERSLLGRFFIGNMEIPIRTKKMEPILDALARAPYPELWSDFPSPSPWAPAARPMAPVLSISVLPLDSPFIVKQIIVSEKASREDDKLFCALSSEREVSL